VLSYRQHCPACFNGRTSRRDKPKRDDAKTFSASAFAILTGGSMPSPTGGWMSLNSLPHSTMLVWNLAVQSNRGRSRKSDPNIRGERRHLGGFHSSSGFASLLRTCTLTAAARTVDSKLPAARPLPFGNRGLLREVRRGGLRVSGSPFWLAGGQRCRVAG
jgi:hypothetical protein